MDRTRLVHKANQIADYFKAYPEDEAVAAVANHIQQFWDPRMRAQLALHVGTGGKGLEQISLAAALSLRQNDAASK